MNISYKWLKQYLEIDLSREELTDKLTFSGIEVEAIHQTNELLDKIIIAKIVKKENHPGSDHLSVCTVFDGNQELQVVCGAPNCAENQHIAFAPVGTQIGDLLIKKAKLRGVESFGMICSEKELGLSENHEGILILDETSPIGEKLSGYLDANDTIYEVEITPNRPDLLGMIGIARDLSAQLNLKLKLPECKPLIKNLKNHYSIEIQEPELCTRYIANVIKGVKILESPAWLKESLSAAGIKPINNLVDITNFIMMEWGHPLHAFDSDKLDGDKIIVRKAHKGEIFSALDHNDYLLTGDELVIADSQKALALAGIIGGTNSHITNETVNILLEAASFNPGKIRKTSYRMKIFTDSSYRFERGMSDQTTEIVSMRAVDMILNLCGGELVQSMLDVYPNPKELKTIALRPSRIKQLLTLSLDNNTIINYLKGLGLDFIKADHEALHFQIPSQRIDLEREIDLIEEIIRLHGYNSIESKPEAVQITNKESLGLRRDLQDYLVTQGFYEVLNVSFSDPAYLEMLSVPDEDKRRQTVNIMNPQGATSSILRSSLLPGLIKNALYNYNYGQKNFKLFELNKVFTRQTERLASENWQVCGVLSGLNSPVYWKHKAHIVDFYDVKGIVEMIFNLFPLRKFKLQPSIEPYFLPNASADVYIGKIKIASFGMLDPKILLKFDFEEDMMAFDINIDLCITNKISQGLIYEDIPKVPSVSRDISFTISNEILIKDVIDSIIQTNPKLINQVIPFDEFKGKQIEKGFRSISLNILLISETKSLTDETINSLICTIVEKLKGKYQIEMR